MTGYRPGTVFWRRRVRDRAVVVAVVFFIRSPVEVARVDVVEERQPCAHASVSGRIHTTTEYHRNMARPETLHQSEFSHPRHFTL